MSSQPIPKWLIENLSALAERAKAVKLENPENLRELLGEFEVWTVEAKGFCGPWVSTLSAQARQWLKGLEAGRPPIQGLERLLQGILEANAQLKKEVFQVKRGGAQEGTETFFFEAQAAPVEGPPVAAQEPPPQDAAGFPTSFVTLKPEDREGFKDFLQEAPGHLSDIETNLMGLSGQGTWDVMKIYRPFHTLKSLFAYLGFPHMSEEAHKAEALLEPYKSGKGRPAEPEREALLKTLDLFRRQVGLIAEGYLRGRIEIIPAKAQAQSMTSGPRPSPVVGPDAGSGEVREDFIRVDTAKMDGLLEAMEELAICHNQLAEAIRAQGPHSAPAEAVEKLGKLTRGLQDKILSVRMVPVEPLFKRLSRLVRDLVQKTGKTVQLRLEGASTELDKRLVDELWEPLVHLVRNAMDHGLEPMAKRLDAGKSAHGTLTVKAQHLGGDFVLEVADDGRGLNSSKIAEKAGRLGLLPPSSASSPQWVEDLVFRPGFSTASKVTDVSGRGVGLDVVKRRIQALKGSIHLESREGFGCRFIIRIPLTLALMEGVLLRVGRGLFLLPLTQVGRFWDMNADPGHDAPLTGEKNKVPPLLEEGTPGSGPSKSLPSRRIDLAVKFGESSERFRQPVGIEVGMGENRAFVLADEILGKKQVVLKGLSGVLEGFPSVNGAALLSDGRVSLVLDVPSLLRESALLEATG